MRRWKRESPLRTFFSGLADGVFSGRRHRDRPMKGNEVYDELCRDGIGKGGGSGGLWKARKDSLERDEILGWLENPCDDKSWFWQFNDPFNPQE